MCTKCLLYYIYVIKFLRIRALPSQSRVVKTSPRGWRPANEASPETPHVHAWRPNKLWCFYVKCWGETSLFASKISPEIVSHCVYRYTIILWLKSLVQKNSPCTLYNPPVCSETGRKKRGGSATLWVNAKQEKKKLQRPPGPWARGTSSPKGKGKKKPKGVRSLGAASTLRAPGSQKTALQEPGKRLSRSP